MATKKSEYDELKKENEILKKNIVKLSNSCKKAEELEKIEKDIQKQQIEIAINKTKFECALGVLRLLPILFCDGKTEIKAGTLDDIAKQMIENQSWLH